MPASPAPESRPSKVRFSDRVENYVRYRPSYPEAIIGWLRSEAGLKPDLLVADIGSGTGLSSQLFLGAGCTVIGVEPNREMRAAAEIVLAGHPAFRSVDGEAAATTLEGGSVDLICAAQSFHWFDSPETRSEFSRILKPGGWIVLMWNERKLEATPFLRGYEQMLLRFASDYAQVRHENTGSEALSRFFEGDCLARSFPNRQSFDFPALKGRLLSSSYAPAEGEPGHEAMLEELRRLFDDHQSGGQIDFEYDTRVYLGR